MTVTSALRQSAISRRRYNTFPSRNTGAPARGDRLASLGLAFELYLAHAGKTEEGILEEMRPEAEKRSKIQLILNKIAEQEQITASEDEVEEQAQKIFEHYKDADPGRVRIYVENLLTNEKVFAYLEQQGAAPQGKEE
jgi:FKBP-type peptidyl-prolyl cis-trans isomerase (trigger factor)